MSFLGDSASNSRTKTRSRPAWDALMNLPRSSSPLSLEVNSVVSALSDTFDESQTPFLGETTSQASSAPCLLKRTS